MVSAPVLNRPRTAKQAATIFGFPLHFGALAKQAHGIPKTIEQTSIIRRTFMLAMLSRAL